MTDLYAVYDVLRGIRDSMHALERQIEHYKDAAPGTHEREFLRGWDGICEQHEEALELLWQQAESNARKEWAPFDHDAPTRGKPHNLIGLFDMARNINQFKDSKYLSRHDAGRGITLTIDKMEEENVAGEGQPKTVKPVLHFDEEVKPCVLNWTNLQLLSQVCGSEDPDEWPGHKVEAYDDPNVSYGGKLVGGIRFREAPFEDVL